MGTKAGLVCVVFVTALAAACGGSSASNGPAALRSNDIAVVGQTHITKAELAHQIDLEKRSMILGSESCTGGSQGQEDCSDKKGKIPPKNTAAYTTNIVAPVVNYLVSDAQLHAIARKLHISVTQKQIAAEIAANVNQLYGGSEAKYQADLRRYHLTAADVNSQVEFTLLEQNIDTMLKKQVTVTPADVLAYYNAHRSVYETAAATRQVDYVLEPSRTAAVRARRALASGKTFAAEAKGAIDSSALHEPFIATDGEVDTAFGNVAFSLPTDALSPPVRVDKAYARSSLKGRCKPACYFVIRPMAATIKAGTEQPLSAVQAEITSQLQSLLPVRHVQLVIAKLVKQQRKVTRYAPGYAPPPQTTPATGVPDTDDTTAP
jgi:parvulin-like peptidyl-prolyl isomerase